MSAAAARFDHVTDPRTWGVGTALGAEPSPPSPLDDLAHDECRHGGERAQQPAGREADDGAHDDDRHQPHHVASTHPNDCTRARTPATATDVFTPISTIGVIDTVRIDQWLHAVRLTKTRADAAAALRGGHVKINGKAAKPASQVAVGDQVVAHLHRREHIVEVRRLIAKRVGAAIATECFDDHSPPPPERDELQPLFAVRDRGAGRPSKRDRRQIDRLRGRIS